MKPADDMHKLIKKLKIEASSELDKKVNDDISNAVIEPTVGTNIWRVKLAVAAAIVVAFGVGFFVGQRSQPMQSSTYSVDITDYNSAASAYVSGKGGFWRQKIMAAMQPRPYVQSRFAEAGLLKTYKQYLKEKHYD